MCITFSVFIVLRCEEEPSLLPTSLAVGGSVARALPQSCSCWAPQAPSRRQVLSACLGQREGGPSPSSVAAMCCLSWTCLCSLPFPSSPRGPKQEAWEVGGLCHHSPPHPHPQRLHKGSGWPDRGRRSGSSSITKAPTLPFLLFLPANIPQLASTQTMLLSPAQASG